MLAAMQANTGEQHLVEAIGGYAKEFGCHSFKKHTETRLTTIPGGPPITSSLIRVGQNLGAIESRYVRDDLYGQDLCSRICACLDPSDSNFDILPARFNPNVINLSSIDYANLIPGYNDFVAKAPQFLGCLPYLLASLVYQIHFLRAVLPTNHPLWDSHVMTGGYVTEGHPSSLLKEDGVLTGRGRCEITGMRSTGVPMYIQQNRKLDELILTVNEQKDMIDQVETNTRLFGQELSTLSNNFTTIVGAMR